MRIGIDIDNTICNTEELFYELANTYMTSKNISVEEFNDKYLDDFYIKNILTRKTEYVNGRRPWFLCKRHKKGKIYKSPWQDR